MKHILLRKIWRRFKLTSMAYINGDVTDFCPPLVMTSCSAGSTGAAPPEVNGKKG